MHEEDRGERKSKKVTAKLNTNIFSKLEGMKPGLLKTIQERHGGSINEHIGEKAREYAD